jgi:site-specific DNA-methyltransferase (adenine-specific)
MVTLQKNTQDCMKKVYSFVPMQDFSEVWTNEKLYKKYGLTNEEIKFIESSVHPTELNNEQ